MDTLEKMKAELDNAAAWNRIEPQTKDWVFKQFKDSVSIVTELTKKINELESVISRLRCEECADELGTDWQDGDVILCGNCK